MITIALCIICAFSLAVTYLITTFSFFIKVIGAINGLKTKSWNLASAILLINSFFISISLVIIGSILDIQPELNLIFSIFLINFMIIFFGHLLIKFNTHIFFKLLNIIVKIYFKQKIKITYQDSSHPVNTLDKPSLIAWFCLLMGFLFPSMLAVIFNEYRATLFQLSFIFNSIGTLLTVIYTDRRASIYTDKLKMEDNEKKDTYIYFIRVINSRLVSTFLIILLLMMTYLFMNVN